MNNKDRQLCEAVLSPGEEIGRLSFVKVMREGFLLLALPLDRRLALATLALYQPQRLKGRLLRWLMHAMVRLGVYRFLSRHTLKIGDQGVFSGLSTDVLSHGFGFLLGNAGSEMRNLIGVYQHDGHLRVVKCGLNLAADTLSREFKMMEYVFARFTCVPEPYDLIDLENGKAYTSELVKGRSPRGATDDLLVLDTLSLWLAQAEIRKVSDVSAWSTLRAALSEAEYNQVSALENLQLPCPVMHGDFAPWNIKILADDEVKVLDWECAEESGVPGWDLLHYLVQRSSLVERATAHGVVEACMEALSTEPVAAYLKRAGLTGYEQQLLLSYLYYSGRVHQYAREELIDVYQKILQRA